MEYKLTVNVYTEILIAINSTSHSGNKLNLAPQRVKEVVTFLIVTERLYTAPRKEQNKSEASIVIAYVMLNVIAN